MARTVFLIIALVILGVASQDVPAADTSPAPLPVTTPGAPATTPEAPVTTPAAPVTTPEAPVTTTTAAPPTPSPTPGPTPAPIPDTTTAAPTPTPTGEYFKVTENNVTCIMFSGDVKFSFSYPTINNKVAAAKIAVPTPSSKDDVSSVGSCDDAMQFLNITWGPTATRSNVLLQFNSTDGKWEMLAIQADVFMDAQNFPNATDAGKYLSVVGLYPGLSMVSVDTNSSFICKASVESKNFTASVVGSNSTYTATSTAVGVKLQAYNYVPNTTDLQEGSRCEADVTSDLVPIAVGCALAGLVLLVLVSYLVGRRRRASAYQSV